jgi:hypothetical protein
LDTSSFVDDDVVGRGLCVGSTWRSGFGGGLAAMLRQAIGCTTGAGAAAAESARGGLRRPYRWTVVTAAGSGSSSSNGNREIQDHGADAYQDLQDYGHEVPLGTCGEVSAARGRNVGTYTPCEKCIAVLSVPTGYEGTQ